MGDAADVRSFHWPRYCEAHGLDAFELAEFKGRPRAAHPNLLTLHRNLIGVTETEAVCTALASAKGYSLDLAFGDNFKFEGVPLRQEADGLVAIRMTKANVPGSLACTPTHLC